LISQWNPRSKSQSTLSRETRYLTHPVVFQQSGAKSADLVARQGEAAMRSSLVLCAATSIGLFSPSYGYAQAEPSRAEEQPVPYHTHHDKRFGHDHSYPDRGVILREVSKDAIVVSYAGLSFRFQDGVWLEPHGTAFLVVAPPIGLLAPALPTFSTVLARGGQTYIYCNDTYYKPRPDVGGFEVVNDPFESTSDAIHDPGAAGFAGGATPTPQTAAAVAVPVAGTIAAIPTAAVTTTAAATIPSTQAAAAALAPAAKLQAPAAGAAGTTLGEIPPAPTAPVAPATAAAPAPVLAAAPIPGAAATSLAIPAAAGALAGAAAAPASIPVASTTVPAATSSTLASAPPTTVPVSGSGPVSGSAASTLASEPAATAPVPTAGAGASVVAAVPAATDSSSDASSGSGNTNKVFVYPKNGQSPDQQVRDRYECYRFAVTQSGFDPMRMTSGAGPAPKGDSQTDYSRAQNACLEAHGYTVR
jgi:hypothetical protein